MSSLISCTTNETSDEAAEIDEAAADNAPIDENDLNDTTNTQAEKGGEEGLESELDQEEKGTPPVEETAQAAEEPPVTDELQSDLGDQDLAEQPLAQSPPPVESEVITEPVPAPAVEPEKARIRDIRYLSNANGGTVVIETTKPVVYQSRMNPATQQFVIEIADAELPAALQRPYIMKEFGSRFGSINAYQGPGTSTARIVIQLSSKSTGEPIVQQEGTSLVVVPPAASSVAEAVKPDASDTTPEQKASARETALAARTLDEFLTGNQKFYGAPISLQVKDADIRDVVNFLAEESGANIVMSEEVGGKISLKLRKIPWDQALVTVMRARSLGYIRQGNVLRISSLKALHSETELSNKLIEAQKNIVPAIVQVLPISYSNMEELVKAVTPFLSKDGKVVADKRSNTLIITDKGEVVERVMKLVKTLDIAPAQVSIESKIVEALEGFDNFVGVNWGATGSPVSLNPSGGVNGAPLSLLANLKSDSLSKSFTSALPFSASVSVGTLDIFGDLSATLSLAEHDTLAKVISAPRISTINREKSTILQQGENVSVITTRNETSGATTSTEKRTPFALELSVTPQITADGGVIMDLDVKREFLGPIIDGASGARAINTRKAQTKVLVRNGQTAVIGGIYSSDELEANNGIPGLMHIPILGWLFKNRITSRSKNELLIFMTPRILAFDHQGAETNPM